MLILFGDTREGEEPFTRTDAAQPGRQEQSEKGEVKATLMPSTLPGRLQKSRLGAARA